LPQEQATVETELAFEYLTDENVRCTRSPSAFPTQSFAVFPVK
jgi:hypothetical protein